MCCIVPESLESFDVEEHGVLRALSAGLAEAELLRP
jgi:hypothetical protein